MMMPLSPRCQPWRETPSQLIKKPWVQAECWNNNTPMVYCPPNAWVQPSARRKAGRPRPLERRCYAAGEPELEAALRAWREHGGNAAAAAAAAFPRGAASAANLVLPSARSVVPSCANCLASDGALGMRPCSKAQERQESFVLDLAAAFGVERNGTFLEVGGNDGLKASNTVHAELCRGWRGLLVEANYISFSKVRSHRLKGPDVYPARPLLSDQPPRPHLLFASCRRSAHAHTHHARPTSRAVCVPSLVRSSSVLVRSCPSRYTYTAPLRLRARPAPAQSAGCAGRARGPLCARRLRHLCDPHLFLPSEARDARPCRRSDRRHRVLHGPHL